MNQKLLFTMLFAVTSSSLSFAGGLSLLEKKVTFQNITTLETELQKWVETVDESDLIGMSGMKQRPDEVGIIEFLFPYLLPDGYSGKGIALNCLGPFEEFRKERDTEHYDKWKNCIEYDFRVPLPYMSKVLKDLKP